MSLNILIAGCLPKDRREIEGVVKKAFDHIPETDSWSVSLVKMGSSWSISLEGGKNVLSLTAPEDGLRETIAEALGTKGTASPPSPLLSTLEDLDAAEGLLTLGAEKAPGTAGPTESPGKSEPTISLGTAGPKMSLDVAGPPISLDTAESSLADTGSGDRYECSACGQPFKVLYKVRPRETKVNAPAACPHCWHLSKVSIPESAAANEEYRAEAVST